MADDIVDQMLELDQEDNGLGPTESQSGEILPYNKAALQRVPQGDINQCQSQHNNFQCPYRAIGTRNKIATPNPTTDNPNGIKYDYKWDGPAFCPRHQGQSISVERRERMRIYHVAQWRDRIAQHGDHPRIKSLREDIGILRMTLEAKLERMQDLADLDMRSSQITTLVQEIARTIQIGHKIEKESGFLLDRTQALVFIEEILAVVSQHVTDPEVLQIIINSMSQSVERTFPEPDIQGMRNHKTAY